MGSRREMTMRRIGIACAALAAVVAVSASALLAQGRRIAVPRDSLYLLPSKSLEGKPVHLKDYVGKVALVVNLASR